MESRPKGRRECLWGKAMIIYSVSGYYLDDELEFDKFLITSTSDCIEDLHGENVNLPVGLDDEHIFYYGMDVPNEMGNDEFKITSYEVFHECN